MSRQENRPQKPEEARKDLLQVEGVNYNGYGTIPYAVMQDRNISIEAKGIYAYFCSFAGKGTTEVPGRDEIIADLGISQSRYYKHFDILKEKGLIRVEQMKEKGKFTRNIYTLVDKPGKYPCAQNEHTKKPYTQNEHTENTSTDNGSTENKCSQAIKEHSIMEKEVILAKTPLDKLPINVRAIMKEALEHGLTKGAGGLKPDYAAQIYKELDYLDYMYAYYKLLENLKNGVGEDHPESISGCATILLSAKSERTALS